MNLNSIVKRSKKTASRIIDGEAFIVCPLDETLHHTSEVGARIWEILKQERKVSEIVEIICEEYDVSRKNAESDVMEFLEELREKKVVEIT